MTTDDLRPERLARIALAELGEPGDLRIANLIAEMGPIGLHRALTGEADLSGLRADVAARLVDCRPDRTLARAEESGIRYVIPGDLEWPGWIDDLEAAEPVQERGRSPLGLWVRGPLRLNELAGTVAVVGSRSATTYGAEVAGDLAEGLARADRCVVSGAAFGIDQAAHRAALAVGGRSVAVLACGVDRAYPLAHHELIEHLAKHGAVVSELAPGLPVTKLRFLARNRLIAALGSGTVIVEAAIRSGALNTANWTGKLHRPLMAVPGPVSSVSSEGTHELIRTGAALLVTSPAEVLEVVGGAGEHLLAVPRGPERSRDRLTARQAQVLDAVPVATGAASGSIARAAGMGLVEVSSALGSLAAAGLVRLEPDGWRLTARA